MNLWFLIMIRDKMSRFLTYTKVSNYARRSIISAIGAAFSFSIIKNPLAVTKSYDHIYDLAVIGGGSGGLATAF